MTIEMILNKIFLRLLSSVILMIAGFNAQCQNQPAEIKVLNATPQELQISFDQKKANSNSLKLDIHSNEVTAYKQLPSHKYSIIVASNEDELLKKTFGLASAEKYTQVIYGIPSYSSRKNEETFTHKMHYIFEGSENYTKNGFLPGIMTFRDKFKLKKGATAIRVFHAAAGVTPINLKLREGKKTTNIASKLSYAKPVLIKQIKSGEKTIEVYLGNAPRPFIEKKFNFQSQKAYIIVLINVNGKPAIKILEN
ncbi:hypothetical protein C7S20_14140 [Christiangramia fulva]|uniref:DUF4397 domain-containing protein n=1 Tax=Christiangramia fulva TaxID=2126553 RepID=A0A2R3Z7U9_9FLAO|nr:DUF4397 domain-containing protein [Christiangramia fulva]AVR46312.1 hypothetical protein C7S20_14140 [Christiangramia fulva]